MKNTKLDNGFTIYEFESVKEMYDYLNIMICSGAKITNTYGVAVELNNSDILTYNKVKNPYNFKDELNDVIEKEIIYPDYERTFLNILWDIKANFNSYPKKTNIFDKKYKKVIILLLDGMGDNILRNNLNENSFLRKHFIYNLISIYPSTTAAATTSIKSGMTPISSGWTGWENYFSEMDKNVILFNGINFNTNEPTGVTGYKKMPYKMFYDNLEIPGYVVEPDFSQKNRKIKDVLDRSIKINKKKEDQIQYVYYTEPDSTMHEYGAYSKEAKQVLIDLDKAVENYAKKLTKDTLLIITADHGHTDVKPVYLNCCTPILNLLRRNPSNDARCITFAVIKGKNEEFEALFNSLFKNIYKLYKTKDAIKLGFFGKSDDFVHPLIDDFLADYVAVAISNYYFVYKQIKDDLIFKSHHAGITKDEMLVPLIVVKK